MCIRDRYDALQEMFGMETYGRLMEKGVIEVAPLAYMRGRTLSNAFVILDEAQNTTVEQMKMFQMCIRDRCVWEAGSGYRECVYASNGDPFYSACADYAVSMTVPASYTAASSGAIAAAEESGGRRRYEMALQNARDFAVVLSLSLIHI